MVSLSTHKYFNRAFGKMSRKLIKDFVVVISSVRLPPADGSLDDDEFEDLGQSVSRMSHPEGTKLQKEKWIRCRRSTTWRRNKLTVGTCMVRVSSFRSINGKKFTCQ